LLYSEVDDLGFVGADGDEVVGDNGHGVVVDGEFLETLGSGVDQAQTIGFPRM
jgi:hypothetical protein